MHEYVYGKKFYYPDGLDKYLQETKTLDAYLQDGLKVFEDETFAVISPGYVLDNLLKELEKYVDHISSFLECDCSDFFENSQSINKMRNITQTFIDFRYKAKDEQDAIRDSQLRNLRKVADSQVTGLDFGIISNSILSHLVYSEMNDAKKKKQEDEASQYYWRESDNIYRQNSDALSDVIFEFSENYYIPILKQGFKGFYFEAFNKYMSILNKLGKINLSEINETKYDIYASNSVLNKQDSGLSVHDRIYNAFNFCPYNPEIYKFAYENKSLTYNLYMLSLRMGTNLHNSIEINDADEEDICQLKKDLSDNWFPVWLLVPMIEKKLFDIDSNVISLFNNLPKEKQESAAKDIIKHLELEIKNAKSVNKDIISSELLEFLDAVKALYSSNPREYEKILCEAFKYEIEKVCLPFDKLVRFSASPEALAAYARNHSKVEISNSDIVLFVRYYEILKTDQMNKIVSLIGGLDVDLFNKFISQINEKIRSEQFKYHEREKAEEKRKQAIEAKKVALKREILTLNSELENLGLAFFGKKAHRKQELKELITKKQSELNNLI